MLTVMVALATLQAAPVLAQEATVGNEIRVLGTRLKKLKLDLVIREKQLRHCRISISSGDRLIDQQACKAASYCVFDGITEASRLLACMNNRIFLAVQKESVKVRRDVTVTE